VLNARTRLASLLHRTRILKYQALSTCQRVSGTPKVLQPVLFVGEGAILIGEEVEFGWRNSLQFHTGYCHLEASTPDALIEIGDGSKINNNAVIRSEGPGISIGVRALIGSEVTIYDSDFHDLSAEYRRGGRPQKAAVRIAENVFIGDRVLILKGVNIGANSVIGAGSVVSRSIPEGVIAAGNPARVIGELPRGSAGDVAQA
jgi:acetyltransferase-like isoleucine patch superfamily enzyme